MIFGNKCKILFINKSFTEEFFIDNNFQNYPPKFRSYKLFVLSSIKKLKKSLIYPYILALILINYLDNISYERIFKYLYENYEFRPKTIHSDFEKGIHTFIENYKNFDVVDIYFILLK